MQQKILIVDEEAGFTQMVRRGLERTGRFQVCEENDPANAMSSAATFGADLILVDMNIHPLNEIPEKVAHLAKPVRWTSLLQCIKEASLEPEASKVA